MEKVLAICRFREHLCFQFTIISNKYICIEKVYIDEKYFKVENNGMGALVQDLDGSEKLLFGSSPHHKYGIYKTKV